MGVCAGHGTELTGCKSPRQVSAQPKARSRARASPRSGVWRKPHPEMRGDAQEPDTRCGTPGTSGHVTAKSSMRAGVCLITPASRHRKVGVVRREVCMASRSKGCMKSGGPAGKPGGNREHKPPPEALTRTERGTIPADRQAEVSRGHRRHARACCRPARLAGGSTGGWTAAGPLHSRWSCPSPSGGGKPRLEPQAGTLRVGMWAGWNGSRSGGISSRHGPG
jgi:hypothetical protein